VLDRPIGEWLASTLAGVGVSETATVEAPHRVTGEGELVVTTDDLWITPELASVFVAAARARGTPALLALSDGLFTEFSAPIQDLRRVPGEPPLTVYPMAWLPAGSELDLDIGLENLDLDPIVIHQDVQPLELPVHRIFAPDGKIAMPMTYLAAVRICHWVHILRANQLALLAWGARLVKVNPLRLLWAVIRAFSFNKWRVMEKLTTRGKGCDIHPKAIVEACTLGNNVKIGAGAIVRYCHVGDGANISDQCHVSYSVIGAGASVSRTGILMGMVLYPGSNTGHPGFQLSVLGRDTFMGSEVVLADFKPDGEVMVQHRGALVSTGTRLLGCAVGHDCRLLFRAAFYSGREIPNGLTVIGDPRDIVMKIPDGLPAGPILTNRRGVLAPLVQGDAEARDALSVDTAAEKAQ
jgi:carbonic anhydrase/acetyltransferase-like protein (isoleucine patch superfamily)